MKTKIIPLSNRLLIKQTAAEGVSRGGIVLPDSAKEAPTEGEVLAVGRGKTLDNGELLKNYIKVGDVVLFVKFGAAKIRVDHEEFLIVSEDDVLAVKE